MAILEKVARTRTQRASPIVLRPDQAAGDALSDFLPAHARPGAHHAAAATEDVREALAVAVRMRRGGRSGSRRTREQPEAPYCRPFFE